MTLRDKVWFILNQYNGGLVSNYAENMFHAIDKAESGDKNYSIGTDYVSAVSENPFPYPSTVLVWYLSDLLGRCILYGHEDFFHEDC